MGNIPVSWRPVILGYLILINLAGFILMGADKRRAKRGAWRISEKTLFLPPLLGGTVGAILGMRVFHHKTKHWYFRIFFPLLAIVQLGIFGYLMQILD